MAIIISVQNWAEHSYLDVAQRKLFYVVTLLLSTVVDPVNIFPDPVLKIRIRIRIRGSSLDS